MGDEAGGVDLGEHPPGHLPAASLAPASRKAGGDGADLAADEVHATAVKGPAQAEVGWPVAIPRPDHDSAVEASDGAGPRLQRNTVRSASGSCASFFALPSRTTCPCLSA